MYLKNGQFVMMPEGGILLAVFNIGNMTKMSGPQLGFWPRKQFSSEKKCFLASCNSFYPCKSHPEACCSTLALARSKHAPYLCLLSVPICSTSFQRNTESEQSTRAFVEYACYINVMIHSTRHIISTLNRSLQIICSMIPSRNLLSTRYSHNKTSITILSIHCSSELSSEIAVVLKFALSSYLLSAKKGVYIVVECPSASGEKLQSNYLQLYVCNKQH